MIAATDLPAGGGSGVDLLRGVRAEHPTARRVLLVDRGRWRDHPVRHAMVRGEVDSYLFVPWLPRERWLYQPMSEYLAEWSITQPPERVAVTVVGGLWDERSHQLREVFTRANMPFVFLAAGTDAGRAVLAAADVDGSRLPIVRFHSGLVLVQPTDAGVVDPRVPCPARRHRLRRRHRRRRPGRSVVRGVRRLGRPAHRPPRAVPAGWAGGSELHDPQLPGFPHGISGAELTNRALEQAWLFGAEVLLARRAVSLTPDGDRRVVTTDVGDRVRARAVVLATGVTWRRLQVPALEALVGSGVFYGAAAAEADAMTGRQVVVVGGANSAGQAALHLARSAAHVTVVVRRPSLAETMSDYLVRGIDAEARISVLPETVVLDGGGRGRLDRLVLRSTRTGEESTLAADGLFVMIGAQPDTDWLPGVLARDEQGYVLTGADAARAAGRDGGAAGFVETSMPGVYAVGDVRHGATKRVSSSVGSGAIAIQLVHDYLAG